MEMRVHGEIIHWRGPAPYHFVAIPPKQSAEIKALSRALTYGWGVIPVRGTIGATNFTTSLFPKGDAYLLPIKNAVRFGEGLALGQSVTARLTFAPRER